MPTKGILIFIINGCIKDKVLILSNFSISVKPIFVKRIHGNTF